MRKKAEGRVQEKARKRHFPWVRPRPSPKARQKYEPKHLQPLARKLFERLSELTGVPVKELLPWKGKSRWLFPLPSYSPELHSIDPTTSLNPFNLYAGFINYLILGPKITGAQHETIHSFTSVLDTLSGKLREEVYPSAGIYRVWGIPFKPLHPLQAMKFQHKVNDFYRKHGVDGLLALFVRIPSIKSLEDLERVERELTQNYLPKGGFTPKGIRWFKAQVTKAKIEKRLQEIKRMRRKEGLPTE